MTPQEEKLDVVLRAGGHHLAGSDAQVVVGGGQWPRLRDERGGAVGRQARERRRRQALLNDETAAGPGLRVLLNLS